VGTREPEALLHVADSLKVDGELSATGNAFLNGEVFGHGGYSTLVVEGSASTAQSFTVDLSIQWEGWAGHFLHIESYLSHCGGGCHGVWRETKYALNSYCSMHVLSDETDSWNGGGDWSHERVKTRKSIHGDHCTYPDGSVEGLDSEDKATTVNLRVKHTGGSANYGGPWFIVIRSHAVVYHVDTRME